VCASVASTDSLSVCGYLLCCHIEGSIGDLKAARSDSTPSRTTRLSRRKKAAAKVGSFLRLRLDFCFLFLVTESIHVTACCRFSGATSTGVRDLPLPWLRSENPLFACRWL
jgi:hypothetical protein